ncbi:MAG: WD40 repeat domain-containing protein [Pirellulales bacterium]|nr:WD40 repeat domain-containing protein [Pirellulales bacterium]
MEDIKRARSPIKAAIVPSHQVSAEELTKLFGPPDAVEEAGHPQFSLRGKKMQDPSKEKTALIHHYAPFSLVFSPERNVEYITTEGAVTMDELQLNHGGPLMKIRGPAVFTKKVMEPKPEVLALNAAPVEIQLTLTESGKEGAVRQEKLAPFEQKSLSLQHDIQYLVQAAGSAPDVRGWTGKSTYRLSVYEPQLWVFSLEPEFGHESLTLEWTFANGASEVAKANDLYKSIVRPVQGRCPLQSDFPGLARSFNDQPAPVTALCASPDGKSLLLGDAAGAVRLLDVETGRSVTLGNGHQGPIRRLACSANGCFAASGGSDGDVRLWDLTAGKELHRLKHHRGDVTGLKFMPADQQLLSAGRGDTAVMWSVDRGKILKIFQDPDGRPLLDVGQGMCGFLVLTVNEDAVWRCYKNLATDTARMVAPISKKPASSAKKDRLRCGVLSPNSTMMLGVKKDGHLFYQRRRGGPIPLPFKHSISWSSPDDSALDRVHAVAISANGFWGASVAESGDVVLWALEAFPDTAAQYVAHAGPTTAVAFTHDNRFLITAGDDRTVRFWSLPQYPTLQMKAKKGFRWERIAATSVPLDSPLIRLKSVAWTPDGKKVRITLDGAGDAEALDLPESQRLAACLCCVQNLAPKPSSWAVTAADLSVDAPFFLHRERDAAHSASYVTQEFRFTKPGAKQYWGGSFVMVYDDPQLKPEAIAAGKPILLNLDTETLGPAVDVASKADLSAFLVDLGELPGTIVSNVVQAAARPEPKKKTKPSSRSNSRKPRGHTPTPQRRH